MNESNKSNQRLIIGFLSWSPILPAAQDTLGEQVEKGGALNAKLCQPPGCVGQVLTGID